jgi:hypothetical protein
LEVEPATWAEILRFLLTSGWQPTLPIARLLGDCAVKKEDALALAAAGRIVLEETMKDPLAAYSVIKFDMGKLAEIVKFASEGEFTISTPPLPVGWRRSYPRWPSEWLT